MYNENDLTTASAYKALIELSRKFPANADLNMFNSARILADFLDSQGKFYLPGSPEVAELFAYVPNWTQLSEEAKEEHLEKGRSATGGLPAGYVFYAGRTYNFNPYQVIPATYAQYWLLMYLNSINYDSQHIEAYLAHQLSTVSIAKENWLIDFKKTVRQNFYSLYKKPMQDQLFAWIENQQRLLNGATLSGTLNTEQPLSLMPVDVN